jgi:hypothetical protein
VTTGKGHGSVARFQLHLAVLQLLQEIDVRYLISDSLIGMTPSLRFFLDRLGFLPMNLRVTEGAERDPIPPDRLTVPLAWRQVGESLRIRRG